MVRRRRSSEEARTEILDAAEYLLATEGANALKVARVAAFVGMSHPTLLHHFGSAEELASALHRRISGSIRDDLLAVLADGGARGQALDQAAARLADPSKGRLLAWLLARGDDPFPPLQEQGLGHLQQAISAGSVPTEDGARRLQLVVLALLADSLFGEAVRARLGPDAGDAETFRRWLLRFVGAPTNE